jgi:Concanavalin A-like lectin/glucanases superfamily
MATSDAGLSSLTLATYSTNTYYSTYFPSTGSYLTGSNTIFNVSSTTVVWNFECWVYPVAGTGYFFGIGSGSAFGNSVAITYGGQVANKFSLMQGNGSSNPVILNTTNTYAIGNWYHVAVSRTSAGVLRIFVNGVQDATVTYNTAAVATGTTFIINGLYDNNGLGNNGGNFYLSNLRFMVGAATPLYTANFNPPVTQLTAIANTSLLACNTINFKTDGSVNNLTITSAGSVSYRQFTPILQANASVTLSPTFSTGTTSYTFSAPSNIVAISLTPTANDATYTSIKFNSNVSLTSGQSNIAASGPYFTSGYSENFINGSLQYANSTPVNVANYSWTVELWVYPTSYTAQNTLFAKRVASSTTTSYQGYLAATTGIIGFYQGTLYPSGYAVPLNQWSHVAYTYDGNNITIYVNGSRVYILNILLGADVAGPLQIGGAIGYTEWTVGNISNFRMVKGYQIYTGNFTPPTSPLGLTQSASTNIRAITGGPTTQGSLYLKGASSQWVSFPAGSGTSGDLGAGDFTLECWTYLYSRVNLYPTIFDNAGTLGQPNRVLFTAGHNSVDTTKYNLFVGGGSQTNFSTSVIYNSWVHIALVRVGTIITLYVNGKADATTITSSTNLFGITTAYVGGSQGDAANCSLNGLISNFRIVKGTAQYTQNFIPSGVPFTVAGNTTLLVLQTNITSDASSLNSTITASGSPSFVLHNPYTGVASTVQPNSNSVSLPGSTEINFGSNSGFAFKGNPYTVEFWVYPNIATSTYGSTNGPILVFNDTTGGWGIWDQNANGVGNGIVISARAGLNILGSATSLTLGAWNHVVAVRSGLFANQTSIFLNGVRIANGTDGTNWTVTGPLKIGGISTAGYYLNGYMSNVRVVNGYAVYDPSQITLNVPKSPLVAITNTQLLALQTTITADASTNNITATTSGSPTLSTTVSPFISYGSGSNQYLSTALAYQTVSSAFNPALSLGQGHNNFTAEAWIYLTGTPPGTPGWYILQKGVNATPNITEWSIGITSTSLYFQAYNGIPYGGGIATLFTVNVTQGQWIHVALTKVGTSVNIWYNGTYTGTVNGINNLYYTSSTGSYLTVGNSQTGGTTAFAGYISNARIVYGKALYTVNYDVGFTPSTTPYNPTQSATSSVASIDNASSYVVNNGSSVYFNNSNDFLTFPEPASYFYSAQFNGTSQYLSTTAGSTQFALSGTSFTIETWVYFTSYSGASGAGIISNTDTNANNGFYFYFAGTSSANTSFGFNAKSGGSFTVQIGAGYGFSLNTWYHLALSKIGNSYNLFANGSLLSTQTSTSTWTDQSTLYIGAIIPTAGWFPGYISNLRLINGTGLYSSSFTPSTTPLRRTSQGAIASQVSLLTLQNTTIIDNSTNAFTITNNGTVTTSQKHPFTAYGDGSDVTVEAWVLLGATPTTRGWIINNSATSTGYFGVAIEPGLTITVWSDSNVTAVLTSTALLKLYTWTHVAVTLVNNLLVIYIDGVRDITTVAKTTVWQAATLGTVYIGRQASAAAQYFPGYITNLRMVYGTAVYTNKFTVPTSPLTATSTTVFLGLQNSVTYDASANNATITKGSGATGLILAPLTSPFSTYIPSVTNGNSLAFGWLQNTAGDAVRALDSNLYQGSMDLPGDFTFETWFFMTTLPSSKAIIIDTRASVSDAGYVIYVDTTGKLQFFTSNSAVLTGNSTLSINTWYHIACTRQNGTQKFWINGIQEYSTLTSTSPWANRSTAYLALGSGISESGFWYGYLSNFRLIMGVCIYTGDFTPSITPYSLTSPAGKNITAVTGITTYPAVGNPYGTTYSGSMVISGRQSASFLFAPYSGRFDLATYDFTIEAWFYSSFDTNANAQQTIASCSFYNTPSDYAWHLYIQKGLTTGTVNLQSYNGFTNTSFTVSSYFATMLSNQWYHVAAVRTGTTVTLYLNGIAVGAATITNATLYFGATSTAQFYVGAIFNGVGSSTNNFVGYISNVRVLRGYGVYTNNFIPAISPLTNTQSSITNNNAIVGTVTSLLALQNSTTSDASSNNLTLTATGSPTVSSTIIPYLPGINGYSAFFNGTTDYITVAYNLALTPRLGDYTIEAWVYFPTVSFTTTAPIYIMGNIDNSTGNGDWALYYRYDFSRWEFVGSTTGLSAGLQRSYNSSVPIANQWYHIAGVKSGSTISCYVNGVKGIDATIATVTDTGSTFYIGRATNAIGYMNGYMSNLRIVKGVAVYTGNFTVPTSALTTTQSSSTNISAINGSSTFYNSFNGSSQYLTTPSTANFAFPAATDFTVEFWFNTSAPSSSGSLVGNADSSNNGWVIWYNNVGVINFQTSGASIKGITFTPSSGYWYHYALVRIGTTINVYLNGVVQGAGVTNNSSFTTSTVTMAIGYNTGAVNANFFNGFISNLRITKGVGVYTGNFIVPTSPLTATQSSGTNISAITTGQTVLLTCQSALIVDNSTTPVTITNVNIVLAVPTTAIFTYTQLLMFQTSSILFDGSVNGFTSVNNGTPTLNSANMIYSPFVNANGRSVGFTDSSQYIQAPSNAVFTFGSSNNFTIEGWIYLTSGTTSGTLFDNRTGATTLSAQVYISSNVVNYAVAGTSVITGSTINTTTWYHIAVVRISNVTKLYVNGIQAGNSYTDTNNYVIGAPYIGTGFNSSNPLNGYISNLRVVNGTGVYPNNFIVPVTVLTSTQSVNTPVIALGSSIPSLGNSVYFNGANDYMKAPGMVCDMGTGDFTIETYYFPTSFAAINTLFGQYTAATTALGYWNIQVTTAGIITVYYNGGTTFTASTAILINEWYHIVLVRVGSTITLYVNGVSYGTASYSGIFGLTNTASPLHIGATQLSGPTQYAFGYMSNLRIVKGLGVYTGAFTVPTSPLGNTQSSGTNISAITGTSTSLLLYQNSPFIDNSTYADTITPFGNPQYSPVFSPSFFTYTIPTNANSGYFNGTTSYLSLTQPSNAGTGDFTIECWIYPTSIAASGGNFILSTNSSGSLGAFQLYLNPTSGVVTLSVDGASTISGTTLSAAKINAWMHIAVVRISGILYMYINGYRQTATLSKTTQFGDVGVLNVGRYSPTSTAYFSGYITNIRFVYGTALYTGLYNTPPYTAPLTAVTNTTLLLLQTTLTKDNSTNNVTVTNTGVVLSTYTNPYTMMQLPVALTAQNSRDPTSATGFRDNSMYSPVITNNAQTYVAYQRTVSPFGVTPAALYAQSSMWNDSSINNYKLTPSNNVTPSVSPAYLPYVNPFSGNAIAFNGSTQYITSQSTIVSGNDKNPLSFFNVLGGDFTIEFFMMAGMQTASTGALIIARNNNYTTATNNNYYIMCSHPGTGHAGPTSLQTIQIYNYAYSATTPVFVGATPVCDSKWHHIAIVRISNIVKVYIDGVLDTNSNNSFTNTGIWDYSNYTIGSSQNDGSYNVANLAYNGMLSNLRIINGTGIYTGTFTPPTNNLTLSQTSRTNVVAYTPTTISTATGYSWGFYGTNPYYLSMSSAPTLSFGLNDYTVEFWNYLSSRSASMPYPCFFANYSTTYTSGALAMYAGNATTGVTTKYHVAFNGLSITSFGMTSNRDIIYGKWTHIALVRRSGIVYLYINGILDSSSSSNGNYVVYSSSSNNNTWYIGGGGDSPSLGIITGYISNFRVVNGIGLYSGTNSVTSNFTLPASGFNTTQSSSSNIAAISTALVSNGAAVYFSGAGNSGYYSIPYSATGGYILDGSISNLTVEAWVYLYVMPTSNNWTTGVSVMFGVASTLTNGIHFVIGLNNLFIVVNNTSYVGYPHNMIAATWYHVAYVINNGVTTIYVNGVSLGSQSNLPANITISYTYNAYLGTGATTVGYGLNGYISNLRVLKAIAVYTGNFTPSITTPLTNSQSTVTNVNAITGASTSLLLQSSITTDSSTNAFTLTKTGTPALNTTVYPGFQVANARSAYFQSFTSLGSALTIPSTVSIYNNNVGTFTLECWVYPIPFGGTYQIIISNDASAGLTPFGINSTGTIFYGYSPTSSYGQAGVTSTVVTFNAWNHLAFVRNYAPSGGTVTIYINGQSGYTVSNSINYSQGIIRIGAEQGGTNFAFTGYISNVRLVNGIALYTSNFTVPTSTLSTTQSANVNGNPSAAIAVNTYAGYFNGGQSISVLNTTPNQFVLGNNNFTLECYFNSSASGNPVYLFDFRGSDSAPYPSVYVYSNVLYYFTNAATRIASSTLLSFTWYHCAVTRNNNITTLYLNGVPQGTYTDTNTYQIGTQGRPIMGTSYTGGSNYWYGYISNIRIVNGSVVYNGAFTPPTTNLTSVQSSGTNINAISAPTTTDGYYNNYFANSGSMYLSVPGSQYVFGTNPFTVECYVYVLTLGGNLTFVDNFVNTTFVTGQWSLYMITTTGYVVFTYATGTSTQTNITTTIGVPIGRWTHVAAVRTNTSANGFKIYLNGLLAQTATLSASIGVNATSSIGVTTSNKSAPMYGFISNVRITNGIAVYTDIYSPQSSPLTNSQSSVSTVQSSLLVAQNATTTDASTNTFTLTAVGSPTMSIVSPFAVINGGSVIIGTSSYAFVPSAAATARAGLAFGTGDFTVEVYTYLTSLANQYYIYNTLSAANDSGAYFGFNTAGVFSYGGYVTSTSLDRSTSATLLNTWTHIAYVRISGVESIYFNGVLVSSTTRLLNLLDNNANYIGYAGPLGVYMNGAGYLSNFRAVRGLGVYTGNFTPPTQPLTITQSSGTNIQAITGVAPSNGSSVNFNGSSYLSTAGSSQLAFGNSQYTIEFWVYFNSLSVIQCLYDLRGATTTNTASFIQILANNTITYNVGTTVIITSSVTFSSPYWYHIAVVGSNQNTNGVTMYVNGFSVGTGTDANTHSQFGLRIGQTGSGTSSFSGNISNFRILVGTALYTSNFAVTNSPLTAITNTKILVLQNSTTTDASLVNYTLTATGTVTLSSTLSPFINSTQLLVFQNATTTDASTNAVTLQTGGTLTYYPIYSPFAAINGSSVYFTGSSQYLTVPSNSSLQFGTQDFTIECWVYILNGNTGTIYDGRTTLTSTSPVIYINSSTVYYAIGNTIAITGTPTMFNTTWYHVAVTRVSNNTSLYINGVQTGNIYADNNVLNTVSTPSIGTGLSGTNPLNGYITNLRIVKGFAVYTNNFIVPIIPLTATVGGNIAAIPALTSTNGYYATAFNGTNQYLTIPTNTIYQFGSGDFTVETWVYVFSAAVNSAFVGVWTGTASASSWLVTVGSTDSTKIRFGYSDGTTATFVESTTGAIPVATWTHIAVLRTSGTLKIYSNGAQVYSAALATTFASPATGLQIVGVASATFLMQTLISNLRVTKGVAVYTGAFTPQTTPLAATQSSGTNIAAITGTSVSLLTCQSSLIVDNSTFSATNIITNSNSVNTTIAIGLFGNNSGVSLLTSQSSTIVDNSASTVSITNTGAVTTAPVVNLFKTNNGITQLLILQNNTTLVDNSYNAFTLSSNTTIVPANGLFNTGTTQLLALQSSLTTDTGSYGVTLTPVGFVQLSTVAPFVATNGNSISFNGTNQYLTAPSNAAFTFGTGDFTIEGWVYLTGVTTTGTLYDGRTGLTTVSPQIYINSNFVYYAVAGNNVITGSALNTLLWYHIAVSRVSGITTLYINGAKSGSSYTDTNNYVIGSPYIGQGYNNTYPLTGYISNLRVVKGTGVYPYNFTPSTIPLTNTQSSSASTRALSVLPTTGYYSGRFDGANGYISFPKTTTNTLSGSAFTIEAWVYFTNYPGSTGAYNIALLSTINTANNAGFLVNFTGSATAISGFGVYAWASPTNVSNAFPYSFSLGTWYHVAITRTLGGTFTGYVNGTNIGSYTNVNAWTDNTTYYIGYNGQASYPYYMPGFITSLRITLGQTNYINSYTSFTPSTTTLTATQSANTNGSPSLAIAQSTNTGYYNLGFTGNTSQYLTLSSPGFVFGTNPFTIECWVYTTSFGTTQTIIDNFTSPNAGSYVIGSWKLYLNVTSGVPTFVYATSVSATSAFSTLIGPSLTSWTHIAVVRTSASVGGFNIYINGVSGQANTLSQSIGVVNSNTQIGTGTVSSGNPFNGYITNIRLTNGVALYTNLFIPQTTPFTAIQTAQTPVASSLLALQNSTTTDASANNLTLTATGSPTVNSTIVPYMPVTNGYSVYFNGSSQYLSLIQTVFALGTGDFTIECWFNVNSISNNGLFHLTTSSFPSTISGVAMYIASNNISMYCNGVASPAGGVITPGVWYHAAIVRASSVTRLYLNGVFSSAAGAVTDVSNYTGTVLVIGGYYSATLLTNGYISNFRITKGIAVYTGNFTVPTSPLATTQSSGTNIVALPGGSSTYYASFNGSNQYLTTPNNTAFSLSGGSYTIELWAYWNNISGEQNIIERFTAASGPGYTLYKTGSNTIQLYGSGTVVTSTSTLLAGTWYHIAISYNGTNTRVFINGTQEATAALNITDTTAPLVIGSRNSGASGFLNGYVSNVRIVKGVAVYTGNFTVPTAPLTATQSSSTNISAITAGQTVLLTCQSSLIVDNSIAPVTITNINSVTTAPTSLTPIYVQLLMLQNSVNNDASVNSFNAGITGTPTVNTTNMTYMPFVNTNGRSVFFTGSTQYINAPSNAVYTFGTGDFTIEGYIYLTSGTTGTLYDARTGATTVSPQIYITASTINYAVAGASVIVSPTIFSSIWYHVAVVRISGVTKLYVNGIQAGVSYTDTNSYVIGSPYIGTGYASSNPLNGYISNLRVITGTGLYTNTFVVPTTPLTANAVSSVINALPAPTTTSGYYATAYSGLTTQYLSLPGTPFVLGTNPFTVECWVYSNSLVNNQVFVDNWVNATFVVGQWTLYSLASTGYVVFAYATSTVAQTIITTTIGVPLGQWTHVAAVRTSTSTNGFTIYINGIVGVTTTISVSIGTNATSSIGILTSNKSAPMTGFISNVRITNLAVYTGAFTPQTTPFTVTQSSGTNIAAITGTSVALLTAQSSTIIDNSTFATTITNVGTVVPAVAFGLFNNSGVSLLTAQNSTFVDNSVNGVTITNTASPAVTTQQVYGLFGTSVTALLALQNSLTLDSSIFNSTLTAFNTGIYALVLERTMSPFSIYNAPTLLTAQSAVAHVDSSINAMTISTSSVVVFQTTMTPYGTQTPTALLTLQGTTSTDATGYHTISNPGLVVLNSTNGPFNNDTALLTLQGSVTYDASNNKTRTFMTGGGVSPTDSSPFANSKSLTGLLIPYGYNDISIANSPIANNANVAQPVTVYNPYTIPSSLISVLGLQTSNTVLESSINFNTFTTSGTAPTSSTLSPFGTYNSNGILTLNTAVTTGITGNIVNFANLLVTANDGVTTNSYSIAVTALNTNNIGNRVLFDTGYNPPAPLLAANIDTTVANITLSEPLISTPLPLSGNITITQWMMQDYRNYTLVANTQTGASNLLINEGFNSNISEPLINTPIPLSGNIIITQWMTQDSRNYTLTANASTGGANLFVTSTNVSIIEPTSNIFLANIFSTPRSIVDVGTNPPGSSVSPVLYPTYAYTDGVFITASNVQGNTGTGSSFASNQQVWY